MLFSAIVQLYVHFLPHWLPVFFIFLFIKLQEEDRCFREDNKQNIRCGYVYAHNVHNNFCQDCSFSSKGQVRVLPATVKCGWCLSILKRSINRWNSGNARRPLVAAHNCLFARYVIIAVLVDGNLCLSIEVFCFRPPAQRSYFLSFQFLGICCKPPIFAA